MKRYEAKTRAAEQERIDRSALPQAFPLTFPHSYRALQPDGEPTIVLAGRGLA
jgi:hypothetical protein